jgi:small subunit ribosomal protein S2
MPDVALKELLQAGVHFGHQTHRWNPKMRKYIFAERGGIYIIDLKKTLREIQRAQELVRETVVAGNTVLFVCTKPQLKEIVQAEAERAGAFYVTERWMGGMLTNFQTIKKNVNRLKDLERGADEGAFEFYTKKEQLLLGREQEKLERYLSGIKDMSRLPGLVFVVDAKKEEIAVREANRLGIPVVAIADTNADPDMITVPIAGNDDAIRSVSLITRIMADTLERAKREAPQAAAITKDEEAYTYSSDMGEADDSSRRKRRRPRPRRRPKPEVIAQRLHLSETGEEVAADGQEAPPEESAVQAEEADAIEPEAAVEDAEPRAEDAGEGEAPSEEEVGAASPDASGDEERRADS